jgi:hypothetical protein
VTVSVAPLVIPPNVAVIMDVPIVTVLSRPEALIVATDVFDELHVTVDETSRVVPSEYVPVATSWSFFPSCWLGFVGAIAITCSATLLLLDPAPPPPQATSRSSISESIALRMAALNTLPD